MSFRRTGDTVAGVTTTGTVPDTGRTDQIDPADLLLALSSARRTGTLRIAETQPTWVVFVDGTIALAGRRGGTTLMTTLGASGKLDRNTLQSVGDGGGDPGVATRLIAVVGWERACAPIRSHVLDTVFSLLIPSADPYAFVDAAPPSLPPVMRFDAGDLVTDARSRLERWRQVVTTVPDTSAVFRPRRRLDPEPDDIRLSVHEWTVVSVLDGRRTVAQAIAALGRDAFTVCSAIHDLAQRGLVERST